MQASRPPENGDITGFSGSETIPLFPRALSATANKRRNEAEVKDVREVKEVEDAEVIAAALFS
jgi:hypothetical protein